jgi:hypothetical protein
MHNNLTYMLIHLQYCKVKDADARSSTRMTELFSPLKNILTSSFVCVASARRGCLNIHYLPSSRSTLSSTHARFHQRSPSVATPASTSVVWFARRVSSAAASASASAS